VLLLHRLLESTNVKKTFEPYFSRDKNLNAVSLTCVSYSLIAGVVLLISKYISKDSSPLPSIGKLLSTKGDLPETVSLGREHLLKVKESFSLFQQNRASLGLERFDNLRIDAIEKLFEARLGVFFNLPDSFLQKLLKLSPIGENMAESVNVAFTVTSLGPFISKLVEAEVKKLNLK